MSSHRIQTADTFRINRSLCGFYDGDFIQFPASANTSYRIRVLGHQSPESYGVYLRLFEQGENGYFNSVAQTINGNVVLEYTTGSSRRNHVVRVGSTLSEAGGYGGGNYILSVEKI